MLFAKSIGFAQGNQCFLAGETKKTKNTFKQPKKPMIWEKIRVSSSSGPGSPNLLPDHLFFWFFEGFFGFFGFASRKALISLSNSMLFAKSISFA